MKLIIRHWNTYFVIAFCACFVLLLTGPQSRSRAANSGPAGAIPGSASGVTDPAVVSTLERLLQSPRADVRTSALDWISRDPRAQSSEFVPQILAAAKSSNGNLRDKAIANLGWIIDRYHGTATGESALTAIEAALRQNSDRAAQLAALDLIGGTGQGGVYYNGGASEEDPFLVSNPTIRKMIVSMLANPDSSVRPQLLHLVSGSGSLRNDPRVVTSVADALHDDDLSVRNDAIRLMANLYKQGPEQLHGQTGQELKSALRLSDPNVRLQAAQALGVPVPPPPPQPRVVSLTGENVSFANVPFDFNYFTAFVQPLFVKKYGNAACIDCHTPESNSSGRFRILAPGPGGRYTIEQSRVNFASVLAVIDRKDPLKSKLLLKPLDPTTREGSLRGLNHDGGVFWHNEYDPDFKIVADWLQGAKLEDPPQKQLNFAYFSNYVERIFSTPGPDGFACINCHFSHAILHLESPETAKGKFSIEEVINNYQSALRVVDESAPSNSFIVRKPTSPREGVPGGLSHAGGIRWPQQKQSWQYKALITWIGMRNMSRGAASRTEAANASSGR
jgi:HEAT repeat protein